MRTIAAKIYISIVDNVLESEDWPVMRLDIDDEGNVWETHVERGGAYSFPDDVDQWSLGDLYRWLLDYPREDEHPQVWNILVGSDHCRKEGDEVQDF